MDVETLEELNKESIERARNQVGASGLEDIYSSDDLMQLYSEIHSGSGFKKQLTEHTPTYYRKETALARDYRWRDANPVIVYMPHWTENGRTLKETFKKYTGLYIEGFLQQVELGYIIPVFGDASEYKNDSNEMYDFYQEFFDTWDEKLNNKKPIFANALERAALLEDKIAQEQFDSQELFDVQFWKPEFEYLKNKYPQLMDIEEITPTEELKTRDPGRYFAERMFMLRKAGFDGIHKICEDYLNKYTETGDKGWLNDATVFLFYAQMMYNSPVFRCMGGKKTYSMSDYVDGIQFLRGLIERRDDHNIVVRTISNLYTPISKHVVTNYKPLSFPMPSDNDECESAVDARSIVRERDKFTDVQSELREEITECIQGSSDISEVREQRTELRECMDNYISLVEEDLGIPYDILATGFDIGGTIASKTPSKPFDPVGDPISAALDGVEILHEPVIEYIQKQKKEKVSEILGSQSRTSMQYSTGIDVWQAGISPEDFVNKV